MFSNTSLKGVSPFISVIIVVAITVGVGAVVSLFLAGFLTTQAETAESAGTSLTGCGGASISVDLVDATNQFYVVSNPTRHTIYTTSVVDDTGLSNSSTSDVTANNPVVQQLTAGSVAVINTTNMPSGASTEITFKGFCEFASKNVSIEGICKSSGDCWKA